MLRYTAFQYYIETISSRFCTPVILEHLWHLPFDAKIVCNITWRMAFLTWTKPGDNLEFFGKKNWEPCFLYSQKSESCNEILQTVLRKSKKNPAEDFVMFSV